MSTENPFLRNPFTRLADVDEHAEYISIRGRGPMYVAWETYRSPHRFSLPWMPLTEEVINELRDIKEPGNI
jgi:hypothetical protein